MVLINDVAPFNNMFFSSNKGLSFYNFIICIDRPKGLNVWMTLLCEIFGFKIHMDVRAH